MSRHWAYTMWGEIVVRGSAILACSGATTGLLYAAQAHERLVAAETTLVREQAARAARDADARERRECVERALAYVWLTSSPDFSCDATCGVRGPRPHSWFCDALIGFAPKHVLPLVCEPSGCVLRDPRTPLWPDYIPGVTPPSIGTSSGGRTGTFADVEAARTR